MTPEYPIQIYLSCYSSSQMERDLLTSKASQEKLQRMAADSEARADAASAQVCIFFSVQF